MTTSPPYRTPSSATPPCALEQICMMGPKKKHCNLWPPGGEEWDVWYDVTVVAKMFAIPSVSLGAALYLRSYFNDK